MNDLTQAEFDALYGPWSGRTPADAARAFDGFAGPWWIAGGWSLEAFTGVSRHHEDIDPCVLRCDLSALRRHFAGRTHLWTAAAGALKPLLADDDPTGTADEVLPEQCGQVWTRDHALAPWDFDILLTPGNRREWIYKRDDRVRLPLTDAIWERDGVCYQNPEITLLFKARLNRAKDQADLRATLPRLSARQRDWLGDALNLTEVAHPWLDTLAAI